MTTEADTRAAAMGLGDGGLAPLLHVGYHKTGSTLLQERFFTRGEFGFERMVDDRQRIHPLLIQYGPFEDPAEERIASLRQEVLAAASRGCRLVISHERLSGYPASGGFDGRLIADRLKQIFPAARILVFVREQKSMLFSYYLQYISDGGSLSFDKFVSRNDANVFKKPEFDPDFFAYVELIDYYAKLFGRENLLVIPYEALRAEAIEVAREIVAFAGIAGEPISKELFDSKVNSGNPMVMQALRRKLNGLVGRNQLSPHAMIRIPHFQQIYKRSRPVFSIFKPLDGMLQGSLKRDIARFCAGRYGETNRRLQEYVGRDLAKFGYEMG